MNHKVCAILQARFSSSRLPGKVLLPILGRPMLARQIERLRRCKNIDLLVLATSQDPSDDPVAELGRECGVDVCRGSLDNVLERYHSCAVKHGAEHVVRVTGDCPLIDPEVTDRVISFYFEQGCDYASNTLDPTFPDGLDVEVFSFRALETAHKESFLPSHLEHVTQFIVTQPGRFRLASFKESPDLSNLRWTVDEPEDLEFVKAVYEHIQPVNPEFGMREILELTRAKPEIEAINSRFARNEGLAKSLKEDKEFIRQGGSKMKKNLSKSLAMQERAKKRIPGMAQLLSKRPDQFSLGVWPGYYDRAKGARIWDLDGNEYLDMSIGGIGATVLGYADPEVDAAVMDAIQRGSASSLNCPEEVELAELLCDIHPWAEMVRYARAGGEAMTVAVRIARAATGRDLVAFCGYHGWHDWYLAANLGQGDMLDGHLLPGLDPAGVPRALAGTALPFTYNKIEELEALIAEHGGKLAAIVMEPMRNIAPLPGFLQAVRELADKCGAVLLFDEVSAAFRVNSGGMHLTLGVNPDMAVFAKSLANGYPMGAIIGRAGVMDAAQKSFISSTHWTERIGPAAALAAVKKHRRLDVGTHLGRIGALIHKGWRELSEKHGLEIKIGGLPAIGHFTILGDEPLARKALFVQLMLERGYLASNLFYAMYAHTPQDAAGYLDAADESFAIMAKAAKEGGAARLLQGKPAASGFKRIN